MTARLRAITLPAICPPGRCLASPCRAARKPSGACDTTADAQCASSEGRALREQGKTREMPESLKPAVIRSVVGPGQPCSPMLAIARGLSGWRANQG